MAIEVSVFPPFDIGDVVIMRGHPGQLMTVEDVCECGSVYVVWFAGNEHSGWELNRDVFPEEALIEVDPFAQYEVVPDYG